MEYSSPLSHGSRRFQLLTLAFTTILVLSALIGVSALAPGGDGSGVAPPPQPNSSVEDKTDPDLTDNPTQPSSSETDSSGPKSSDQSPTPNQQPERDQSETSQSDRATDRSESQTDSDNSLFSRIATRITELTNSGEPTQQNQPTNESLGPKTDTSSAETELTPEEITPGSDSQTSSDTQVESDGEPGSAGQKSPEVTNPLSGIGSNTSGEQLTPPDWVSNQSSSGNQPPTPELLGRQKLREAVNSTRTNSQTGQQQRTLDSFNPEPRFEPEATTQTQPRTQDTTNNSYWRTTAYESYNTSRGWSQGGSTDSEQLPSSQNATGTLTNITVYENASIIPTSGDVQGVSIQSGANPREYNFTKRSDGTVTATDTDGNLKSVPDGTTLRTRVQNGEQEAPTTRSDTGKTPQGTTAPTQPILTESPDTLNSNVSTLATEITNNSNTKTQTEKAETITDWVRQNNQYRPHTETNRNNKTPSEFLLTNKTGGTTTFATGTALLMREEGIPARVVTGYRSPNNSQSNPDTVDKMDQHMWVEAKNESGSWNRYDPVPSHKDSIQSAVKSGNKSAVDNIVSEAVVSDWQDKNTSVDRHTQNKYGAERAQTQSDTDSNTTQTYIVTLTPQPKPGQEVTVEVSTVFLDPVFDAGVQFNGNPVGKTGVSGDLETSVPYTDTLNVTIAGGQVADTTEESPTGAAASTGDKQRHSTRRDESPRLLSHSTTQPNSTGNQPTETTVKDGRKIYTLPTTVEVKQNGTVLPGDTVTATTTIDGDPTPGLRVTIDGKSAGETNTTGDVSFTIPENTSQNETLPITATRGEIQAQSSITTSQLTMSTDGQIVTLPGRPATVTVEAVTLGTPTPLSNTQVELTQQADNGDTEKSVMTLDADGKTTITLLSANQIDITARTGSTSTSQSLSGLYFNTAAIVIIGLTTMLTILGGFVRRYELSKIQERILAGFFTATSILFRLCSTVWTTLQTTWRRIQKTVQQVIQTLSTKHPLRWIWTGITTPTLLIGTFYAILERLRTLILSIQRPVSEFTEHITGPPDTLKQTSGSTPDADSLSPQTVIRRYWKRIITRAIGRKTVTTKTTVEIESRIIDAGLPKQPIQRVRQSIQNIQYGDRSGEDEITSVETAVTQINDEEATEQLESPRDN